MPDFLLACDEGTSSVRAVVYDRSGREVGSSQKPIDSQFPQSGWVEQDANEIFNSQFQCINEVIDSLGITGRDLHAVGITNQRETTVVWDRNTGKPIAPAITWQCRRTSERCEEIKGSNDAMWITECTGLQIDPYFSASKIQWLLENVPDAQNRANDGQLAFGSIDSWLIYKLTNGKTHVIDRTNASRTMLMDLKIAEWDSELLKYFDISQSMMPTIVSSLGVAGVTDGDLLGAEIPIAGIVGDQQAAMIGQQCTQANIAKLTYGTGAFLLLHTGHDALKSKAGLLSTTAASLTNQSEFALEGSVFSAGSAVQWLRDGLGLIESAEETESLAHSVASTEGVYLVPAFEGLGAPHWRSDVSGTLVGLSRGTDRRHIARATLEAIAFQCYDLIRTFENETGSQIAELRVDGGAARNGFLMQFQADLLNRPVVRPLDLESTVRGAATLAGKGTGFWEELPYEVDRIFEPNMLDNDRKRVLAGWQHALDLVLH